MEMMSAKESFATSFLLGLVVTWLCFVSCRLEFVSFPPNSVNSDYTFYHIAVDNDTGQVYAGALNRIVHLDENLQPLSQVTTGPALDNPNCPPTPDDNSKICQDYNYVSYTKQELGNVNKILLVDSARGNLITCGTLFQGICQLRNKANITSSTTFGDKGSGAVINQYYVSANLPQLSTVAFLGSGPPSLSGNVLYSASTLSKDNIAHGSYAIASRLVTGSEAFTFTNYDSTRARGTMLSLNSDIPITYTGGFSFQGYSYFLSYQSERPSFVPVPKIAQICQYAKTFMSYVDMPLTCVSSSYNLLTAGNVFSSGSGLASKLGIDANDGVLFASFSTSSADSRAASTAICVFAMNQVVSGITNNVMLCLNGSATTGLLFGYASCGQVLRQPVPCSESQNQLYGPISGSLALTGIPLFNMTLTNFTAVAVDTTDVFNVLFLGTSNGHLIKVYVDSKESRQYDDIAIEEDSPINSDIWFSPSKIYLYVSTPRKLYKVPVEKCSIYTTAQSCLALNDPYCGWCTFENKCSRSTSCVNSNQSMRWLSSLGSQTFDLVSINGNLLSQARLSATQVRMQFSTLPTPLSPVFCQFGSSAVSSVATVSSSVVTCSVPASITSFYSSKLTDSFTLKLSLFASEVSTSFYATNVTIYNCSYYSTCSQCASSSWKCQWCIYDNKCTDSSSSCAVGQAASNYSQCPTIGYIPVESRLIAVGIPTSFYINGANLPDRDAYQCLISISTVQVLVNAHRVNNTTINCVANMYNYEQSQPTLNATVNVIWLDTYKIESNIMNQVTLYKCPLMASDCSTCLSFKQVYNCFWCSNQCTNPISLCQTSENCPNPDITNVYPTSGPIEGGTLVTIEGINLGTSASSVDVLVMGFSCFVESSLYRVSVQIVCRTEAVAKEISGPITVIVGGLQTSWGTFYFKNPNLLSIFPSKGPLAGGTLITLNGSSLLTGLVTDITIIMSGQVCQLVNLTNNQMTFLSPPGNYTFYTSELLTVKYGNTPRTLTINYQYTANPVLVAIYPITSFSSGGRNITIEGFNLDCVLQPRFGLLRNGRLLNSTICQIISSEMLVCPSPAVPIISKRRRQAATSAVFTVSLMMDGVPSTRNISAYYKDVTSQFTVVPDPIYAKFAGDIKYLSGETLELTGQNLNLASWLNDTFVFIGRQICVLKSLDESTLFCTAPSSQPPGVDKDGNLNNKILPDVTVSVGNLMFNLGKLQYQTMNNDIWIIIVAVLGGALLVVIFVVFIVIVLQRSKADRRFKKMQIQLDTLESNVRNECKQAFAELQTDVSDLTSDLSLVGIPFWDFRMYTFKVLFPGCKDHPILHNRNINMLNQYGSFSQGLSQFNQLLCHRTFLVTFIHCLEQQRDFTVKDKANVASLLTVILQDKMDYATDILKLLLNELIDRSIEKKQPKLMLRRTESVVEKFLTNWLSLCLYSHLKKHAGRSLFMLNKAIKHQTEKGPIDAVTADARYSLSEDKLLREKLEPKTLTVTLAKGQDHDTVLCRMLDCDTITQAKEKALDAIYLNIPFSRRPSVHSRDLVWKKSPREKVILQDEDERTMRQMNGWKRLNTLGTYGVRDEAVIALVPRTEPEEIARGHQGEIEILDASAPIIRVNDDGVKIWHLVKPDDSVNMQRDRGNKVISEIFLTRLLTTKMTLQQYVDDMFLSILKADSSLPPAVKYIFDFFDSAARRHGITDADVVHTWKSNSLLLRFWVNIVKNPEFVFDISKSHIVDSCLSVIAQTFMDSCSTTEHRLGKDSPSNKLLFAKDIPRYRQMVANFYSAVHNAPSVSDQDMNKLMAELSMANGVDFNVSVALTELYKYAHKYKFELIENLEDSSAARKLQLGNHLEQVMTNIEDIPTKM